MPDIAEYAYGLHGGPNEYFVGDVLIPYLEESRAMGMAAWVTQNKDRYTYQLLRRYGFSVVLFRPMLYCSDWYQDLSGVDNMLAEGYNHAIPYNEPSDVREWTDGWVPQDYIKQWADRWIDAAEKIVAKGARPGVQCLDPRIEFRYLLQRLKEEGRWHIIDALFVAVHNYPDSHPPDFPVLVRDGYDIYTPQGDLSFLVPLSFNRVGQEECGRDFEVHVTEGGYRPGDDADNRFPKITNEIMRDYTLHIVKGFQQGKLPNGAPWPRWWKSFVFWLADSTAMLGPGAFDSAAWFHPSDNSKELTIAALKELAQGQPIRPDFDAEPTPEPAPEPTPVPEPLPIPIAKWRVFDRAGRQVGAFNSDANALAKAIAVNGYVQPWRAAPLDLVGGAAVEVAQLRAELAAAEGKIARVREAIS